MFVLAVEHRVTLRVLFKSHTVRKIVVRTSIIGVQSPMANSYLTLTVRIFVKKLR